MRIVTHVLQHCILGRSDNALKIPEEMDASNGVGFMANPTYSDDLKSLAQILLTQVKDLSNYPTSEQLAFKYCNHIVNKVSSAGIHSEYHIGFFSSKPPYSLRTCS